MRVCDDSSKQHLLQALRTELGKMKVYQDFKQQMESPKFAKVRPIVHRRSTNMSPRFTSEVRLFCSTREDICRHPHVARIDRTGVCARREEKKDYVNTRDVREAFEGRNTYRLLCLVQVLRVL